MPVDWGKVAGERRRRGWGEAAKAGQATARRGIFLRFLIQARAVKDPEYWNTFSIGQVR